MNKKGQATPDASRVYVCAPVNALVEGIYEQKIPFTQVKQYGDFGLGTFNNLDGEMVMLDGDIYQITAEGCVHKVNEQELTPFACVTFYKPLSHDQLKKELSYPDFQEWLQSLLPSSNIFYAIRIEGRFSYMRVRSVSKQENYRPLVEVAQEQQVFTFKDIEGTLAGFFTPSFISSLSVPGFHMHFLSADRKKGGHLLECRPRQVRVGVQFISTLELAFPMSLDYLTWDFRRKTEEDLNKVEK
jgi:acetolactate decarboxylase